MSPEKIFCVNCETIQKYSTICLKCQSPNIFYVGKSARFPKKPKRDDYLYFFGILLARMDGSSLEDNITPIYKYITNHKYSNHINPNLKEGLSYKERAIVIYQKCLKRKTTGQIKVDVITINNLWSLTDEDTDKIINKLSNNNRKQGYTVPALGILNGLDEYDINSELNPFKPKSVNGNFHKVFKDKATAEFVASTIAQCFIEHKKSSEYPSLIKYAETYARKKRDLLYEFPEYFV